MARRELICCDKCQREIQESVQFEVDVRWPKGVSLRWKSEHSETCKPVSERLELCCTCAAEILRALTATYNLELGALFVQYVKDSRISEGELRLALENVGREAIYGMSETGLHREKSDAI